AADAERGDGAAGAALKQAWLGWACGSEGKRREWGMGTKQRNASSPLIHQAANPAPMMFRSPFLLHSPRQRVEIDVAARQDHAHALARKPLAVFQHHRQRDRRRWL